MKKNHRKGSIYLYTLLFFMCLLPNIVQLSAQSPPKVIQGVVLDSDGEPLVGATLRNPINGNGTVSDVDGRFELRTQIGEKWMVSYIGMQSQTITIRSDKFLQIRLQTDTQLLNEVVVTGYSKVNSRVFVGSVSKVSTEDFTIAPQTDISRLLEGKAPGLNISTISNAFGAAPKVNIRGGGSINGNVQPLWVVDGAVVEDMVVLDNEQLASGDAITLVSSTIAGLNPADIESIEILKDASATSLYGARGMNGVIVVTSKSGKRGKGFDVNYHFTTSIRQKPSYTQYDMMNSAETMQVYDEMANKGYFSMNDALYGRRGGVYSQMYNAIDRYTMSGFGLKNTPQDRSAFLREAAAYNTDWFDHIYTESLTQNHSLSLSYGSEQATTYASVSYYNDPGETISEKVNRLTAYLKSVYYFSPALKVGANIQASVRNQHAPGTFPRIKNVESGAYKRDFDINPFNYALNTSRTLRPYNQNGQYEYYRNDWAPFNIIEEYDQNKMNVKVADIRLTLDAEWNPVKDLHISALFSGRRAYTNINHQIGENSNVIAAHRANASVFERADNIYLYRDGIHQPQVTIPMGGIYNKTTRTLESYLGRISADYSRQFGEHNFKLFTFAEMKLSNLMSDSFKGYGIGFNRANSVMTSPLIFEKTLNEGENYFSLHQRDDRSTAFSGSLTYNYANRYILNLVGNYEGSNAAGIGKRVRWLPTWNIGGKWNVDEEAFFSPFHNIWNRFALRMSYGLVAKMNAEAINSLPVYDSRLTFRKDIDRREYAIFIKHLENRDLTWEKMYEFNVGTDLGFFNDRIGLTFDAYSRRSFDLIDLISTSGIGGQYYKWANFGDMVTRGMDVSLRTENLRNKDFKWSTQLGFSIYKQEITRLLNLPNTFDMVSGNGRGNIEGFPRGGLYSFELQGLTDRGLPQFYFGTLPPNDNPTFASTGANFYDRIYNRSYLIYEGPTEPYITSGMSNSFSYKNWQLSVFVTAQLGNKIRISPTYDPEFNDLNVFTTAYRNRWMVKGDEQRTHIPVIPGYDLYSLIGRQNIERAYNTYNFSQVNVADGSFVRLKSISLGYTLPVEFCRTFHLKGASIHAQATNLFLLYADKRLAGRDPEYISAGGVSSPTPRTYSMSIQLNF